MVEKDVASIKDLMKEIRSINIAPPAAIAQIAGSDCLVDVMEDLEMTIMCTADHMEPVREFEDMGPYASEASNGTRSLCSIATHFEGGSWYCLLSSVVGGEEQTESNIVFVGADGEQAATVGRSGEEFLQLALSLQPFYYDAILQLPMLLGANDKNAVPFSKKRCV